MLNITFKFHYPARGRKLFAATQRVAQRFRSNSITPQGDGNQLQHQQSLQPMQPFKFHYPARGRKLTPAEFLRESYLAFKFHYPARGRKPPNSGARSSRNISVQIPLPRKGTETVPPSVRSLRASASSNSITPQGDGNDAFLN